LFLDLVFIFSFLKGLPFPLLWQFSEGSSRVDPVSSSFYKVGIPVAGYDLEGKISYGLRQYSHFPDNAERECFLPRSGACTPAPDLFLMVLPEYFSQ